MKKFKYILASLIILAPVLALADDDDPPIYTGYKIDNGVATAKTVSAPDANNLYTITLETFATGTTTIVKTSTPVDVILVLDNSSSMTDYNYTYIDDDGNSVTDTRLAALKYAVTKFVREIARNDHYDDDGNERENDLGNRIQIITFGTRNSTITPRFTAFQDAYANLSTIVTNIGNITESTGTRTDVGMSTAATWANTSKTQKPNSNRVVVMFTDGCPSTQGSTNFNATYAIDAVNAAYTIKQSYGATVYSIGLIDWSVLSTTNQTYVRNMMDYISSNYPDGRATSTNTFTCTGTRADTQYNFYVDANETDLGQIFQSIAEASGGSESSVPGETMLVDEVSSSFEIPSTFSADDVVVYYRTINEAGTEWTGSATTTALNTITLPDNYDLNALPPADIAAQLEPENTVGVYLKDGKLTVIGFNYSKEDSEGADGSTENPYDGNWVGWRYDANNTKKCAGKELVIEFKIEAQDGVTGGDGTNTNNYANSGVFVPTWDENGNFTGYQNVNNYPYPQTDLPIILVIVKEGLKHGESATIQIYRAPQKEGDFDTTTGKPVPDLSDGWENFTKVILTNKGDDYEDVTKKLLCLDPSYVYKLEEDDWGWSYILDTDTYDTSSTEKNPFTFTNTKRAAAVKHAEAVSINHFGISGQANSSRTENYKSSKTDYFTK